MLALAGGAWLHLDLQAAPPAAGPQRLPGAAKAVDAQTPRLRDLRCAQRCRAHDHAKDHRLLLVKRAADQRQASRLSERYDPVAPAICKLGTMNKLAMKCTHASPCRSWSLQGRQTVHTEHARAACDLLKRQQARQIPAAGTRP